MSPRPSLQVTVTSPDLINGIITAQASSIKAFFGEAAVTASFGAVSKLGIASGAAFDVMGGIIGQQSFSQIAASAGLDANLSYWGAYWGAEAGTAFIPGVGTVAGAVLGGFAGSLLSRMISNSAFFKALVTGLGSAAQTALATVGEYSLTYDIGGAGVLVNIYSNGDIALPSLGVTFQANGQIAVPGGTLTPVAGSTSNSAFDFQFTPSGGGATTSFGASFVPPASGGTIPGVQLSWNDGTNGNQTTPTILLPPTSSYAGPEITETYDASNSTLTLWNSANNTAEITQFAAGSTNYVIGTSFAQFSYDSSGQLASTVIKNYNILDQEVSADNFSGQNVSIWTYNPATGNSVNNQVWNGSVLENQTYFSNDSSEYWNSYTIIYNSSYQMTNQNIFLQNGGVQIWDFVAPSLSASSEQSWNSSGQLVSQTYFNWNNNPNLSWSAMTNNYNYTNPSNPGQINSQDIFLNTGTLEIWLENLSFYGIANETVQNFVNNEIVSEILFPNTGAANWSYVYVPFSNGNPQSATYYSSSGSIVGNPSYSVPSLPAPTQPAPTPGNPTSGGGSGAGGAAGSVLTDVAAAAGAVAGAIGSLISDGASAVGTVIVDIGSWFGTVRSAPDLQNVVGQADTAAGLSGAAAAADAGWANMEQDLAAAKGHTTAPSPFEGAKWTTPVITWSFANSPGSPAAPFSGYVQKEYQTVIEQAIQTWFSVSGLKFQQVADSPGADIRIGWGSFATRTSGVIGATFLQASNGSLQQGAIVRLENPSQNPIFPYTGEGMRYSGENVTLYQLALHEMGHALGLAGSADTNSVMFANLGSTNRTLDKTDLANIQSLYGSAPIQSTRATGHAAQTAAAFMPSSPTTMPTNLAFVESIHH